MSAFGGGLILTASVLSVVHRDLVVGLAAKHKLPAVYHRRYFVTGGGLMSYGSEEYEQFRGAARYVDRILKGEKPADMPVQSPTKYQLAINLKTAKALGLDVPLHLHQIADEVIAVLRLITRSNLVGCNTGNSAGAVPLKIRPE